METKPITVVVVVVVVVAVVVVVVPRVLSAPQFVVTVPEMVL